ncbi:hypothetical protein SKAU_G00257410 [Synaphobranchus kaupii]|uniref:Uncharacterized protein n=1 Tax=Synaphobranchus kaupii TaxID=118154 RepID=A0A9Q1F451_SYNKA|nr:hypothetical protein SKAU_G00257410 [Synaphobranchus kaupii]
MLFGLSQKAAAPLQHHRCAEKRQKREHFVLLLKEIILLNGTSKKRGYAPGARQRPYRPTPPAPRHPTLPLTICSGGQRGSTVSISHCTTAEDETDGRRDGKTNRCRAYPGKPRKWKTEGDALPPSSTPEPSHEWGAFLNARFPATQKVACPPGRFGFCPPSGYPTVRLQPGPNLGPAERRLGPPIGNPPHNPSKRGRCIPDSSSALARLQGEHSAPARDRGEAVGERGD